MVPSCLFSRNTWPFGPSPNRRSARVVGGFFCASVLLLNDLQEGLRHSPVVEQNPPDGILAAARQLVGLDVEDLAAGEIAEQHEVLQLSNRIAAVHVHPGDRGLCAEQRIELSVLDDRIRHRRIAAALREVDRRATDEPEAPLPLVPAKVRPRAARGSAPRRCPGRCRPRTGWHFEDPSRTAAGCGRRRCRSRRASRRCRRSRTDWRRALRTCHWRCFDRAGQSAESCRTARRGSARAREDPRRCHHPRHRRRAFRNLGYRDPPAG